MYVLLGVLSREGILCVQLCVEPLNQDTCVGVSWCHLPLCDDKPTWRLIELVPAMHSHELVSFGITKTTVVPHSHAVSFCSAASNSSPPPSSFLGSLGNHAGLNLGDHHGLTRTVVI